MGRVFVTQMGHRARPYRLIDRLGARRSILPRGTSFGVPDNPQFLSGGANAWHMKPSIAFWTASRSWRRSSFKKPLLNVLGGSIGFGAIVPYGKNCGHLFQANPKLRQSGFGDPYLETQWSRHQHLSVRMAQNSAPRSIGTSTAQIPRLKSNT